MPEAQPSQPESQESNSAKPAEAINSYQFQVAALIRTLLTETDDSGETQMRERVETFIQGIDHILALYDKKPDKQEFSMFATIKEMAHNIQWSIVTPGSSERKIVIPQTQPAAHFCMADKAYPHASGTNDILAISTSSSTIYIKPQKITGQYAGMLAVFALTSLNLRDQLSHPVKEGSDEWFRIFSLAHSEEINVLRLVNPEFDDFCAKLIGKYRLHKHSLVPGLFKHRDIGKIMKQFNQRFFPDQTLHKDERNFRKSALALALQYMIAKTRAQQNGTDFFDETIKFFKHRDE